MESFRDAEQTGSRKAALREALAGLPDPSPDQRARVVEMVSGWLRRRRPAVVVGFLAMGSEIDMTPLVQRHPEIRFALTRTAPGFQLTVHPFDSPREVHRFGFEQPAAKSKVVEDFDVVLVPGMAFGPDGSRLGRGAGYYDRFLAGVDAEKVAMTTDVRITEGIPLEAHDIRVDWIATESGIRPRIGR